MIAVTVEVHSIPHIEAWAAQAFASGEQYTANPYRFGSMAHRVWRLQYDKCKHQAELRNCSAAINQNHNQGSEMSNENLFITVPTISLPGGLVVPSFQVGQYLTGKGADGMAIITADAKPWVRINYEEARQACAAIGGRLITESQYLAIAFDIAGQDINWTGGKVGEGKVFQGLHLGTVDEARAGDFVSEDPDERTWHQLSTGERVYGFAGNAYSLVFDDVQGDENGLVARAFAADSPSIATAPFPPLEKGMGWRPKAGANWSGRALARGGCWNGGDGAGVFLLRYVWPDYRGVYVGFRCTN